MTPQFGDDTHGFVQVCDHRVVAMLGRRTYAEDLERGVLGATHDILERLAADGAETVEIHHTHDRRVERYNVHANVAREYCGVG